MEGEDQKAEWRVQKRGSKVDLPRAFKILDIVVFAKPT